MPFTFKHVIISGSRSDTQGPSKFIQEAKVFLEDCGWNLVDDRTTQAGSVDPALTHKMVFNSNGEENNVPTFYLTLFSGTGAGASLADNPFLMHTAYDLGSHTVPVSGVASHGLSALPVNNTLNMTVAADTEVWMSGDSEAVVFISSQIGSSVFDSMSVGKAKAFNPPEVEPYGLYVLGDNGNAIAVGTSTTGRLIAGNPPVGTSNSSISAPSFFPIIQAATNQPYDLGAVNSIYYAAPLIIFSNTSGGFRGAVGVVQNAWESAGTTGGMLQQSTLTASGIGGVRTYRAFTANPSQSIVIRQS